MFTVLITSVEEGDRSDGVGGLSELAGVMIDVAGQRVVNVLPWTRSYSQHQTNKQQLRHRPFFYVYNKVSP